MTFKNDFNSLPDHSRIWIYSSELSLNKDRQNFILNFIKEKLNGWNAHNIPLTAGITILENHFIVIGLDEDVNLASGCSIDTLQRTIQNLETVLSINLMNRMNIFCRISDEIRCIPSNKLSLHVKGDTLFYDLTIQKKEEIDSYLKPISEGWCSNLL